VAGAFGVIAGTFGEVAGVSGVMASVFGAMAGAFGLLFLRYVFFFNITESLIAKKKQTLNL
jgi:hypothetical protein